MGGQLSHNGKHCEFQLISAVGSEVLAECSKFKYLHCKIIREYSSL